MQERLNAAMKRLGITISADTQPLDLPRLPVRAIRRLQEIFPVRLLRPGEDVEAFRHYCGAAGLVEALKQVCVVDDASPIGDESEEVLTAEAVGRAIAKANGTEYTEE